MYSILIVDDEIITRRGLVNHVHWEQLNIKEIHTASGAREALQFIENNPVDIVLSDVRMPGMNGIDMCSEIKKIAPECQIVFLSGYSDKEYLKSAIELEAVSYVEKPISIPEVEAAIEKAIEKIRIGREKEENIYKVVEENKNYLLAGFIQKLINGKLSVIEVKKNMELLELEWSTKNRFNIAIFKSGATEKDLEAVSNKISKAMEKIEHISYIKESKYIVFLFAYTENEKGKMNDAYREVSAFAKYDEQIRLSGSFGCTVSNILHIKKSYESAAVLMQQLFFYGYGKINNYMGETGNDDKVEIAEEQIKEFEDAVSMFDSEKAGRVLEILYEKSIENPNVLVSHVKGLYFRFINIVLKAADQSKAETERTSDTEMIAFIWEKLNNLENVWECHEYLNDELNEYFENTRDLANNSKIIIEIMEYVKNNYMNPELCLNKIAENVYITPNYMNTLFKRKFGKTVGQYITDVRIQKAKELVKDRKIKLSEVAEKVGYNDAGYFTKVFRKNVGISPKDYRER